LPASSGGRTGPLPIQARAALLAVDLVLRHRPTESQGHRSPGSVSNICHHPAVEINVVDPILRKGYRFQGVAPVLGDGALFDEILAFFRKRGVSSPIKHIVVIHVDRALPVVAGLRLRCTEEEVRRRWQDYWRSIEHGDSTPPTGE
jgi:hypothetical protein